MSYKIIIIKTEIKEIKTKGKYTIIGERLLSDDDLTNSHYSGHADLIEKTRRGEVVKMNVYGYPPDGVIELQTIETKMFEQEVENLHIGAVIKAINKP